MMSVSALEYVLQLRSRRRRMADGQFDAGRDKLELKPIEFICTLRGQCLTRFLFVGCFHELVLAQKPLHQGDAGSQFVIGLAVLMKLFFALSDYSFGICGMPFLKREPCHGELGFSDSLLFSILFTQRQRFCIRVLGCLQIPLVEKYVTSSKECIGYGTFVINFLRDCSGLLVTSQSGVQVTTQSRDLRKINQR